MQEGGQQGTNPQQFSADPRLAHQKVLRPSESFVAEVKAAQQPAASPGSIYPEAATGLVAPARAATSANETKITGATETLQLIQPAHPELAYSDLKPTTDSQIPVGVSASRMGFNQSRRDMSWRSLLKPILIVVGVLTVLGAGFMVYKSMSGYGTRTVQGDGFTYTITYSKMASAVSINGKSYLQGNDKSGHAMLLDVGKSTQTNADCHTVAGGTISVIATPEIEGKQHNLCYSQFLNAYDMNFTHNGVWYYLVIVPRDKSQTLNQDTVKMIASSVSISQ